MITANFSFKPRYGSHTIYGTIVTKHDGGYSLSLANGRQMSPAARYEAKALAKKIVEARFKHESVYNLKQVNASGLIEQLTEKTQDLKERFIEATKEAAKRMFANAEKWNKASEKEWFDSYQIKFIEKETMGIKHLSPEPGEYNKKGYYKMRDKQQQVRSMVEGGYEKFENSEVAYAVRHYENSVQKLAIRLNEKGITDGSNFKILKEWVGVNLEITIEHDGKITRAWTIVAEGPIQRPHYRYLIK